ncbi:MAG: hypothetical protein KDD64_00590 [Bdellovibrionales bacterium]|nr:hypothetical protein [Bdellovibrionales bacterium]
MRTFQILLLFVVLSLEGCGYTFRGGESVLPPDVKRVYIPRTENITSEQGLELVLTEALRDEFERYGVLTVVEGNEQADAVLRSKITSVKRETRTVTSNTDTALQLTTVMRVAAELKRKNGTSLWRNKAVVVSKAFGTDQSAVVTTSAEFAGGSIGSSTLSSLDNRELSRGQEQQAFEDLSEQVARRIYSEAVLPEF